MNTLTRTLALAIFALGATAFAQNDLIKDAARQREVATQKAEADLQAALKKANTVRNAEALAILKSTLASIEFANIDETRRAAMTRTLKDRISITERAMRAAGENPAAVPAAMKNARDDARKAELDQQEAERLRIKATVLDINRLLGQGRTQEAERQATELARQYPKNPAAQAMGKIGGLPLRIRDAREVLDQQEKSIARALQDVSPKLPKNDLDYDPERWKVAIKRTTGDPLTKKEQEILKSLSKPMRPDFSNARFKEVLDTLRTSMGVAIITDEKALEEAGVLTDTLVNFSLPREVSTRTVLRKILQDQGLGYVIRDEMIYVTSKTRLRDMMTTRTYYLGDIVTQNAFNGPPALLAQQEAEVVRMIIDTIKRSVDPMSWEGEGGRATIHYEPVTKALVVRQSAEVHMLLRNSMGR